MLQKVAESAARHGLVVAPVGSVFFLFKGKPKLSTKDMDVVIHFEDGDIVTLEEILKVGQDLGDAKVSDDRASVIVEIVGSLGLASIDLLRGRERTSGGFLPRELLRKAAAHGRREGNVLWYPPEFVILLKADAAIDRTHRVEKGGSLADENKIRAEAFTNDTFSQIQWLYDNGNIREKYFREGLLCLKKQRRIEVAQLLESASGGRLKLR